MPSNLIKNMAVVYQGNKNEFASFFRLNKDKLKSDLGVLNKEI